MACEFDIVTLFPDTIRAAVQTGVLGRAVAEGIVAVHATDLREFGEGNYKQVDDEPYGGGAGMVLMVGPIDAALKRVEDEGRAKRTVLLGPRGRRFTQEVAREYAEAGGVTLICGRYEGVDERVAEHLADEELSLGDFVLSGGEFAALCVIDAVSRLIPGVLGNAQSPQSESFNDGLLEYPQFTRPAEYKGWKVPDILLSGHHGNIDNWRKEMSYSATRVRRPDLLCERTENAPVDEIPEKK